MYVHSHHSSATAIHDDILQQVDVFTALLCSAGAGKERAEDAADYGRERARASQERLNRGYENTPSGGDIRREGE